MSVHRRKTKRAVSYDARLRGPDGRGYTKTFKTRRDAEAYIAQEHVDRTRGAWVDPRGAQTLFEVWVDRWQNADPSKRPSTRAREQSIIRTYLLPALGRQPLGSITSLQVQRLVNAWAKRLKPRTVRRNYEALRAILCAAVDADLIQRAPVKRIRLPAVEDEPRPVISADDLARLASEIGQEFAPIVYLGTVLGFRWGECAGLRVGRIDFARGTISIVEQRTRGLGRAMIASPPKSRAGRRTLTVPHPCCSC